MGTYKVRMPQLGETVDSGTVALWLKAPGDAVTAGETLLEIETDKVDTEIEAVVSGTLQTILVEAGQKVDVDTVLAEITVDGEVPDDNAPTTRSEAPTSAPSPEPPSPAATAVPSTTPVASVASASASTNGAGTRDLRLSPLVTRMIADNGLDLDELVAFADGARVSKKVVQRFLASRVAASPAAPSSTSPSATAATPAPRLETEPEGFIPFTKLRRRTADHMVRSKATSPHVLSVMDVEYTAIQRVRDAHADRFRQAHGASLSYLSFVLHALSRTLSGFPHLTARVEGDGLRLSGRVHLGVAVDLDGAGLIVPVIRDADQLSLRQLAIRIARLADQARAGELAPDDVTGGTFTVSSQGPYGTLLTGAIINQPQVAILSVDGVAKRPVVAQTMDGRDVVDVGLVGHLGLSWDHRAIDGTYAARFLAALRDRMQGTDWLAELQGDAA